MNVHFARVFRRYFDDNSLQLLRQAKKVLRHENLVQFPARSNALGVTLAIRAFHLREHRFMLDLDQAVPPVAPKSRKTCGTRPIVRRTSNVPRTLISTLTRTIILRRQSTQVIPSQ